jgi:hypothetical protein
MVRRRCFRGLGRYPGDIYECGNPEMWFGSLGGTDEERGRFERENARTRGGKKSVREFRSEIRLRMRGFGAIARQSS